MSEVPESRPVKFTITHYRQQQHSHEAFMDWIVKDHLPLALPVFKKYGIIEYSLVSDYKYVLSLLTRL
jgi:hypothetical protein